MIQFHKGKAFGKRNSNENYKGHVTHTKKKKNRLFVMFILLASLQIELTEQVRFSSAG